uniref:Uncharacterized protein n=1 Tax=Romanomermis culicivorax TaxID=13658 RepID=A0A915JCH8_ROMCU
MLRPNLALMVTENSMEIFSNSFSDENLLFESPVGQQEFFEGQWRSAGVADQWNVASDSRKSVPILEVFHSLVHRQRDRSLFDYPLMMQYDECKACKEG